MAQLTQKREDLEFGRKKLNKGFGGSPNNVALSDDDVNDLVGRGYILYLSFLHWEGDHSDGVKKVRFMQDFNFKSEQSKRK